MSLRCLTWVFHESPAEGFERLVLLALADEADDDGTNAYPSTRRIARKAKVGLGSVPAIVRRLEDAGHVTVERPTKRGRGHVNRYTLLFGPNVREPNISTPRNVQKCSEALPKSALTHRPVTTERTSQRKTEQFTPTYDGLSVLARRLVDVCTGDREETVPEAAGVISLLRKHYDDRAIDGAIGTCSLLATPPRLPRYVFTVCRDQIDTGTYIPDLMEQFREEWVA